MATSHLHRLTTQFEFYMDGIVPVTGPLRYEECPICCESYHEPQDVVSLKPCNHIFHRSCVVDWFYSQTTRAYQSRCACPVCRRDLCRSSFLSQKKMKINDWFVRQPIVWTSQFNTIYEEANRRLREGERTVAEWVTEKICLLDPEAAAQARQRGILPDRSEPRPRTRLALEQYQVDVDADADRRFVNKTIDGDLESLLLVVNDQIVDEIRDAAERRVEPRWIPLIIPIFNEWSTCGYPRCNYITVHSLHILTVCAALIWQLSRNSRNMRTVSFAHLLAHGEALILDAQLEAQSPFVPYIEYVRLLDRPDNSNSPDQIDGYSGNQKRVEWIVSLRLRTRGRGQNPFRSTVRS